MRPHIFYQLQEFMAHTSPLRMHIFDTPQADLRCMDAGLRTHFEDSGLLYEDLRQLLTAELAPDRILHLQDPFFLHYVVFCPNASETDFCVLGPFLADDPKSSAFLAYVQQTISLPQMSENSVLAAARNILSLAGCTGERHVKQLDMAVDATRYLRLFSGQYTGSSIAIHRLVHYIQNNLHAKLTLHTLSEYLGFSPTYISHHFKEKMGIPPMQYITQQRILYAQYLLRNTDKPIHEIAGSAGISDWSYFTKLFRENTGTTPTEYRKKYTK